MTSQWISAHNQALIVESYEPAVADLDPSAGQQLTRAREYNDALSAGKVLVQRGAAVPVSAGSTGRPEFDHARTLAVEDDGLMARILISRIHVDLLVHHGTGDAVLLRGAGHLEGSHLPIGGAGTRSVITGYRGLAGARVFTDLDRITQGDLFTVVMLDEELTYRVTTGKIIAPKTRALFVRFRAKTWSLPSPARRWESTPSASWSRGNARRPPRGSGDLVTADDAADEGPGFARWALWGVCGVLSIAAYVVRQGFTDARMTTAFRQKSRRKRAFRASAS